MSCEWGGGVVGGKRRLQERGGSVYVCVCVLCEEVGRRAPEGTVPRQLTWGAAEARRQRQKDRPRHPPCPAGWCAGQECAAASPASHATVRAAPHDAARWSRRCAASLTGPRSRSPPGPATSRLCINASMFVCLCVCEREGERVCMCRCAASLMEPRSRSLLAPAACKVEGRGREGGVRNMWYV